MKKRILFTLSLILLISLIILGYNNLKLTVFEADWDKYGRAAGPIRNLKMAKYAAESDRGILIAFPIGKSPGTRNMIKLAKQFDLEVHIE